MLKRLWKLVHRESEVEKWFRERGERREKESCCFQMIWKAAQKAGLQTMLSGGIFFIFLPSGEKVKLPIFTS